MIGLDNSIKIQSLVHHRNGLLTIFMFAREWRFYRLILMVLPNRRQLYVAYVCICKDSILAFLRNAGVLTFLSLCLEVASENVVVDWTISPFITVEILGYQGVRGRSRSW